MYNSQKTADIIKKILFEKKITAKKMCEDCALGVNTLSNIRRGDVKSIETFQIIADYLNVSVDYLIGEKTEPAFTKSLDEQLEGVDFALYGETKELTDEQKQDVLKFIKFLKSKDEG